MFRIFHQSGLISINGGAVAFCTFTMLNIFLAVLVPPSATSSNSYNVIGMTEAQTSSSYVASKTVCTLPILADIQMAAHAYHAVSFYANNYPSINWTAKYVTSNDLSAKNFVTSWVLRGGDCDLLIGAGYSFIAVAMSPLVEVPWMGSTETSTELSDKKNHPSFSRVIPTDEVGAAAAAIVFKKMGWNRTNILCADESYGRSVALGVSSAIQKQGGVVEVSQCLEASATGDRVTQAIQSFLSSRTKVVFIAMLPFSDLFISFREEAKRLNASSELIFFYSEAMCSASDRTYTQLPGGFCATYLASPTVMQPFLTSYRARDTSQEVSTMVSLGFPADVDINGSTNIYSVMAHEATIHGMSAMHEYVTSGASSGASSGDEGGRNHIYNYFRTHQSSGATGVIKLESNGDRAVVDGVLYNSQPGEVEKIVATIKNEQFEYTDTDTVPVTTRPDLYFFDTLVSSSDSIPSIVRVVSDSTVVVTEGSKLGLILGVTFGCLLFVIVAAGIPAMIFLKKSRKGRDVANAPTDQNQPFTIVFTDIQGSTSLWARIPQLMSDAVDTHHQLIRGLLRDFHGYEVKTIGDSFMCAFVSLDEAVNFGTKLQEVFYNHNWKDGNEIEDLYQELIAEQGVDLGKNSFSGNGIRVRVGLSYGIGNVQLDEVTHAYDYYGTVVNTAARVEAVGHGGQFLITDDAWLALGEVKKSELICLDLGPQLLRGLDEPVRLHQVTPKNIAYLQVRKFPPLRLDKAQEVEDGGASDGRSVHSVLSKASRQSYGAVIDQLAQKHIKRSGAGAGGDQMMTQRLLDFHHFTRVLLSTSDKQYRESAIKHYASKWRVSIGSGTTQHDLSNELGYQATLLDLANKVMAVTDAQSGKKNGGAGGRWLSPGGGRGRRGTHQDFSPNMSQSSFSGQSGGGANDRVEEFTNGSAAATPSGDVAGLIPLPPSSPTSPKSAKEKYEINIQTPGEDSSPSDEKTKNNTKSSTPP